MRKIASKITAKRPGLPPQCRCACCMRWRGWIQDIQDFNRSATNNRFGQVIELESLLQDEDER